MGKAFLTEPLAWEHSGADSMPRMLLQSFSLHGPLGVSRRNTLLVLPQLKRRRTYRITLPPALHTISIQLNWCQLNLVMVL